MTGTVLAGAALVVLTALPLGSAWAQAPAQLPLEALLTDSERRPLEGEHVITVSLYDSASALSPWFSESHAVSLADGVLVLQIGSVAALDLAAFRTHRAPFLGITIDDDTEMAPRLPLGSVPFAAYADYALEAGTLEGLAASDFRLATDPISFADITDAPATVGALSCSNGDIPQFNGVSWACVPLPSVTETDPAFAASPAAGIAATDVGRWDTAAGWGDHGAAGYLSSESDPSFAASPAAAITAGEVSNWNAAAGWGDHGAAGYLTAESDPAFVASPAAAITAMAIGAWNAAAAWGDHAAAGYLTAESDPEVASTTTGSVPRWNGTALVDSNLYDDSGRIGVGTSTPASELHVQRPDNQVARVYATGFNQGTGMFYAGQSLNHGGGFAYDGDGSPNIVGGNDRITFFRRSGGTDLEVFSYDTTSPDIRFSGNLTIPTTARYITIPPAAMRADDPSLVSISSVSVRGTTPGTTVQLRAPLQAPHGAELRAIDISYVDNSSNTLTCSLDLSRDLANFGSIWTSSSSGASPSVRKLTLSTLLWFFDNSPTGFNFTFYCRWVTPNPSGGIVFGDIQVTYDITEPLP